MVKMIQGELFIFIELVRSTIFRLTRGLVTLAGGECHKTFFYSSNITALKLLPGP
jgi:hypothetical protein